MTLIASYQRRNEIVMIGDLLLTSNVDLTSSKEIPTRFDGWNTPESRYITNLTQKIVHISDRICVAWAGSYLVARHILQCIALVSDSFKTGDDILDFIRRMSISSHEKESVSFIFYIIDADGDNYRLTVQDYMTSQTEFGIDHKIKYAGSGAFHFLETVSFNLVGTYGRMSSYQETVVTWLSRAAIVFLEEVLSETPHYYRYGGGFEILMPWVPTGKFRKIPYSTFFWRDTDNGIKPILLFYSMQYNAKNDLVINRFSYSENKMIEIKRFYVRSVMCEGTTEEFDNVSIENDTHVHYIIPKNDGDLGRVFVTMYNEDVTPKFDAKSGIVTFPDSEVIEKFFCR